MPKFEHIAPPHASIANMKPGFIHRLGGNVSTHGRQAIANVQFFWFVNKR
jgi:hypothetical protein